VSLLTLASCTSPDPGNELFSRAETSFSSGLYLQAEKLYEEYLQNFPQGKHRWQAWNTLYGIADMVKSDHEKALVLLEAMRLEYGNDPARFREVTERLADLHAQRGHWDKAADAWRQSLRQEPVDETTRCATILKLARAYKMLGQYEAVLSLLRETIDNSHSKGRIACEALLKYELAQTFTLVENWESARTILEDVIASGDLPAEDKGLATFLLAEVCVNQDQPDKALELLRSIRDSHPNPIAVEAMIRRLENGEG
jgi:tetratricopeptide (TPR) repeat protein